MRARAHSLNHYMSPIDVTLHDAFVVSGVKEESRRQQSHSNAYFSYYVIEVLFWVCLPTKFSFKNQHQASKMV